MPHSAAVQLVLAQLTADHGELLHRQTFTGGGAREGEPVAQVAQQGVDWVGGPQLAGGHAHNPRHVGVGLLQLAVAHPQPVLPPLLLLQVSVPGGTVAGRAAEQSAPLVVHGHPPPVEVRQEAVEKGQPALDGAAPACGLDAQLAGRPIGGENTTGPVGLTEELPVVEVLHHA